MDVKCPSCGEQFVGDICPNCVRELVTVVKERRLQIINSAMCDVDKDADKVYALDPTRGRGRGPKWMD